MSYTRTVKGMIQFVLAIAAYFLIMNHFFDKSVAPVGKKLQKNLIPFPKRAVDYYVLLASGLYPMMAFIRARESGWAPIESRGATAAMMGILIGMIVDV